MATRLHVSAARVTPEAFAKAMPAHGLTGKCPQRVPGMPFDKDRARNHWCKPAVVSCRIIGNPAIECQNTAGDAAVQGERAAFRRNEFSKQPRKDCPVTARTTVFGAIFACLASAATAQDSGGFTLRAFGGLSDLQGTDISLRGLTSAGSFSSSTIAGGAVGYDYPDSPWRSEIEFAYRSSEASGKVTGDYASTSIMVNGRYSFPTTGPVTPYVGAGIGFITEIDFDVTSQPNAGQYNDRGGLAGQIMLGADWSLNETWTLFGEARYFTTADTPTLKNKAGDTLKASYRSTDFVVGVTYNF